jgi:misacylated tRNA(Ala) deacylase
VNVNLCYTEAYTRSVEARVVAADDAGEAPLIVLDRTVFYPGGGGQPSDRGLLLRATDGRRWVVRAARKSGSETVHELEPSSDGPPETGDLLTADLDWARRYALMRTHTALHALCGVVWRDYGALVTGGNMEAGAGRMDFEFERMSGDLVGAIEERVNAELASSRDILVNVLPRDEAFAIPDLIRTKVNLLPPGSSRSARSRSSGLTCRLTVARTWRTPAKSGRSVSRGTSQRDGSTSGSGSPSRTPRPSAETGRRRSAGGPSVRIATCAVGRRCPVCPVRRVYRVDER